MNVFLIGFRGTGKTTVARHLAARLGWSWCDADALLEEHAGRTIREIFVEQGEPAFRDLETALLGELAERKRHVIATGGGGILRPENRELLKRGAVVWLTAPASILWERLQADATTGTRRPDLAQGGLAEIETLLAAREPLYRACADFIVDTTERTPEEIAVAIAAWLAGRGV